MSSATRYVNDNNDGDGDGNEMCAYYYSRDDDYIKDDINMAGRHRW